MSPFYRVRPLGLRDSLLAFELQGHAAGEQSDVRELFTLWDAQGQPHRAYPEIEIREPTSGRALLAMQQEAWREHVRAVRALFGAAPLAGPPRDGALRGLLAFRIPYFSDRGRWTLIFRDEARWYFSPQALREGLSYPVEPMASSG